MENRLQIVIVPCWLIYTKHFILEQLHLGYFIILHTSLIKRVTEETATEFYIFPQDPISFPSTSTVSPAEKL
jgi:hypothetical protein